MKYLLLSLSIILEVVGTSFMQVSDGFTKPIPSVITLIAYLACFYFLAQTLKVMPLGVVYAVWGGMGIVLTAIVAVTIFKQPLDLPAIIGIALIVSGVFVMNFLSKSIVH